MPTWSVRAFHEQVCASVCQESSGSIMRNLYRIWCSGTEQSLPSCCSCSLHFEPSGFAEVMSDNGFSLFFLLPSSYSLHEPSPKASTKPHGKTDPKWPPACHPVPSGLPAWERGRLSLFLCEILEEEDLGLHVFQNDLKSHDTKRVYRRILRSGNSTTERVSSPLLTISYTAKSF